MASRGGGLLLEERRSVGRNHARRRPSERPRREKLPSESILALFSSWTDVLLASLPTFELKPVQPSHPDPASFGEASPALDVADKGGCLAAALGGGGEEGGCEGGNGGGGREESKSLHVGGLMEMSSDDDGNERRGIKSAPITPSANRAKEKQRWTDSFAKEISSPRALSVPMYLSCLDPTSAPLVFPPLAAFSYDAPAFLILESQAATWSSCFASFLAVALKWVARRLLREESSLATEESEGVGSDSGASDRFARKIWEKMRGQETMRWGRTEFGMARGDGRLGGEERGGRQERVCCGRMTASKQTRKGSGS
jgi:hypothetical protein